MAASNASNEQRLALREDLKRQLADMRAMQEAAEQTKAEQEDLLARIAAMESKVSLRVPYAVYVGWAHCAAYVAVIRLSFSHFRCTMGSTQRCNNAVPIARAAGEYLLPPWCVCVCVRCRCCMAERTC